MNGNLKRLFCLALAAVLLVGCAGAPAAGTGEPAVSGPEAAATGGKAALDAGTVEYETTLAAELLELPVGMAYASAQCRVGDAVWLGGVSQDDAVLGSVSLSGGAGSALVTLPEGCEFVYAMCAVGENVAVLAGSLPWMYENARGETVETDEPEGRMALLTFDGTEFVSQVELPERYPYVFHSMLEADGSFCILCQDALIRLGADGTETGRFEHGERNVLMLSMCVYEDGLVVLARDYSGFRTRIFRLDKETLGLSGEAEIPGGLHLGIDVVNGALALDTGAELLALDGDFQPCEAVFSWDELFVEGGYQSFEELEDGYLFFTPYQEQICTARWKEARVRKTVVMAADSGYGAAHTLANAFNRSQDEYYVQVNVYESYEEGDMKRLQTEIGAGSWPDLFAFMSEDTLAEVRGETALEDLYGYMDADGRLSREDLTPQPLKVMEQDGALYWVPWKFWMETLIAPGSLVERPGISVEDALRIAGENDLVPIQQWITREMLLETYSAAAMQQFVDWENGTCSFDSAEFADILELCGGGLAGEDVNNGELYTGPDEPYLLLRYFIMDVFNLAFLSSDYNSNYCFAGYPGAAGNGSVFYLALRLAITAGGSEKQGAWEFIRFVLSEEGQEIDTGGNGGLSMNAAVFERELDTLLREGTDEFSEGRLTITEDDARRLRELVDGAVLVRGADPVLEGIISDCAAAFFAGDKTAEQTARDIQARAVLYVAERG